MEITDCNVGDVVGFCPRCNNELILREGKYGLFIGCSNYPKCRKTFNIDGFKIQDDVYEMKKLKGAKALSTILKIRDSTTNQSIRDKAESKLLEECYCECGEKFSVNKIYRTTPDYPHYLKECRCPKCGRFVISQAKSFLHFVRMGGLDGDDSHITGGYWL